MAMALTDNEVCFMAYNDNISRLRPALMAFETSLFLIGGIFWVIAGIQEEAFNAGTYGAFALQFPAEFWAGLMMAGSALTMAGLKKPVWRRAIAVGAIINAGQFLALAASSIMTGGEPVIGLFGSFLFAPAHVWLAWEAAFNGPG